MTVTPVNDTPLAVDDSATTDEDTAISIAVLVNDALGDEPTTITVGDPGDEGHGGDRSRRDLGDATPRTSNTNGLDSFTYTITDLDLQTSTATVSMTVTPINDPPAADAGPDQTAFVTDTVTLDGSGSSDVDGDPLDLRLVPHLGAAGRRGGAVDPTADDADVCRSISGDYAAS